MFSVYLKNVFECRFNVMAYDQRTPTKLNFDDP